MNNYQSKFTGPQMDSAIEKAIVFDPNATGYIKLASTATTPINLNLLTGIGNFTFTYFTHSDISFTDIHPLNISIMIINGIVTQLVIIINKIYLRTYENSNWSSWGQTSTASYIYQQDTQPTDLNVGAIWIDTSVTDSFHMYSSNGLTYVSANQTDMMKISVYDPTGKNTDFFAYVDTAVSTLLTGIGHEVLFNELTTHERNAIVHITQEERTSWNNKETTAGAQSKINAGILTGKQYTDTEILKSNNEIDALEIIIDENVSITTSHINNSNHHVNAADKTIWNGKADKDHMHLSDDRVEIDASKIVSGIIDIARIPQGAIESVVKVRSESELFALTTDRVQNGDIVIITNDIERVHLVSHGYWNHIAYGNGKCVAISMDSADIFYSSDGRIWTPATLPIKTTWRDITYGNGLFIVINDTLLNANNYATSSDGIIWTMHTAPGCHWDQIKFGNDIFVTLDSRILDYNTEIAQTVPYNSTISFSTDGITWITKLLSCAAPYYYMSDLSYIGDKFVIGVLFSPPPEIEIVPKYLEYRYTSTNGVTWTADSSLPITPLSELYPGASVYDSELYSISYWKSYTRSDKCIAAIQSAGESCIISYDNGLSWTIHQLPAYSDHWVGLIYLKGIYIAININSFYISYDCINWSLVSSVIKPTTIPIYGYGKYILICNNGSDFVTFTSLLNQKHIYIVTDESKLASYSGYTEYSAGVADNISWNHVTEKPTTIDEFGITDIYTKTVVDTMLTEVELNANNYTDNMIIEAVDSNKVAVLTGHMTDSSIHTSITEKAFWESKASSTHMHLSDNNVEIDASKVVSGVFSIDRIPVAAIEKTVSVTNDAERFALTIADVQNGDSVAVIVKSSESGDDVALPVIIPQAIVHDVIIIDKDTSIVSTVTITDERVVVDTIVSGTISSTNILNIKKIIYGDGSFVAILTDSPITYYSTDCINWTPSILSTSVVESVRWADIAYCDYIFIMLPYTSESPIVKSLDAGKSWEVVSVQGSGFSNLYYTTDKFILLGGCQIRISVDDCNNIYTLINTDDDVKWCINSANNILVFADLSPIYHVSINGGIDWSSYDIPSNTWSCMIYGNGAYLLFIENSSDYYYSTTGMSWELKTLPVNGNWKSITCDAKQFVLVGFNSKVILISADGITWDGIRISAPATGNWNDIAYGNSKFITTSSNTSNTLVMTLLPPVIPKSETFLWMGTLQEMSLSTRYDITSGNGLCVIVGEISFDKGTSAPIFQYSSDTITWNDCILPSGITSMNICKFVVFGNNIFIAFPEMGGYTLTSIDGITWVSSTSINEMFQINYVWYVNNIFVISYRDSNSNTYGIMKSIDGLEWTICMSDLSEANSMTGLSYGNDTYMGCIYTGNSIIYSYNEIDWNISSTLPVSAYWTTIIYGNGNFIIFSSNGSIAYVSPNTSEWVGIDLYVQGIWNFSYFNDNQFIVVDRRCRVILISEDGIKWSYSSIIGNSTNVNHMHYSNGNYIGLSASTTLKIKKISSLDPSIAQQTQEVSLPFSDQGQCITYAFGYFITVFGNPFKIYYSQDGITWTLGYTSSTVYSHTPSGLFCYGVDVLILLIKTSDLHDNTITTPMRSFNGIDWENEVLESIPENISDICYGNGKFVATSWSGFNLYTSTDGISWTVINNVVVENGTDWESIAYGNGIYVILGWDTTSYAVSVDGITWEIHEFQAAGSSVVSITFGNGVFCAFIDTLTYTSNNGLDWEICSVPPQSKDAWLIYYGANYFILVDTTPIIYLSVDGLIWNSYIVINSRSVSTVAANKNMLVFILADGDSSDYIIEYIPPTVLGLGSDETTDPILYLVTDDTLLSTKEGYIQYPVGTATNVGWTNITGKPSTVSGYGITDTYTKTQIETLNNTAITTGNVYADQKANSNNTLITNLNLSLTSHKEDTIAHVTQVEKTSWNNKVDASHQHLSDGNVEIDGSDIVSGIINIARIPQGAIEKLVKVANDTERFALTLTNVQNGDSVAVLNTATSGPIYLYIVTDETKLSNTSGYTEYTSGISTNRVYWQNILNTPNSLNGYGIANAYTKDDVATKLSEAGVSIQSAIDAKILALKFSESTTEITNQTTEINAINASTNTLISKIVPLQNAYDTANANSLRLSNIDALVESCSVIITDIDALIS